jgi:DNA mismatch repair protein MutS
MTLNLTPAMRQYVEIKSRYRDCILFFRMGDFYEMFFEDALRASRLLDIALTSRDRESNIPMAGVPYHARNVYLSKLVRQGCKVAICEQFEEPGGKGVFHREVTEVVTPGLVFSDELLDAKGNNFLAAVRFSAPFSLAAIDATTGELLHETCPTAEALADALFRLSPAEYVALEGDPGREEPRFRKLLEGRLVTSLSPGAVSSFVPPATIGNLPPEGHPARVPVLAALSYLHLHQPRALLEIRRASERVGERHMALDETALRTLEVFSTLSGERKGSLLWAVDRTSTPMGARTLRRWLSAPLVEPSRIAERHDAVGELVESSAVRKALLPALEGMGDLQRLASRLAQDRSGPRDVAALARSLDAVPSLREALASSSSLLLAAVRERLGEHGEIVSLVSSAIADAPPAGYREGGVFREGYDGELDSLRRLLTHGKSILEEMEQRERERTGIANLKIRYNRVFGYYIEISKANLDRVPEDYGRKQTLANAERFVTPELKEYEGKVLRAEEGRNAREEELFLALRERLKESLPAVYEAAQASAELDVLLSFAVSAESGGYCRPVVTSGRGLVVENGRHPVVEKILGRHAFVPNDVRLSPDEVQVGIITGPNMAGKSTYIRQAALLVLLAHAGSFVPADRAEMGAVDRIFTRIGASDDLARGESTFMVEMRETARILAGITDRSLVVLDEVGRGTSTFDGLSIAWAVAEHLHDLPQAPKVLFATHYHEITDIVARCPRAANYHVAVREWQGEIIFLRRIDEGCASKSYGIQVAKLAGLPDGVIGRAREILKNLEAAEYNEFGAPALAGGAAANGAAAQLDLFGGKRGDGGGEAVLSELRDLDPERMTPFDALLRLVSWKERMRKGTT